MKFKKCNNCIAESECEQLVKEYPYWENRFVCPLPGVPTKKQIAICNAHDSDYWREHTSVEVSEYISKELGYGVPRNEFKSIPLGAEGRHIKGETSVLFERSVEEQRRRRK